MGIGSQPISLYFLKLNGVETVIIKNEKLQTINQVVQLGISSKIIETELAKRMPEIFAIMEKLDISHNDAQGSERDNICNTGDKWVLIDWDEAGEGFKKDPQNTWPPPNIIYMDSIDQEEVITINSK